ncbi:MAG: response regulator [Anaerolineae bacterium]|nr:response regulator [Anaerolineae bacterium]
MSDQVQTKQPVLQVVRASFPMSGSAPVMVPLAEKPVQNHTPADPGTAQPTEPAQGSASAPVPVVVPEPAKDKAPAAAPSAEAVATTKETSAGSEKTQDPCAEVTRRVALVIDDEPANRDFLVRLLEQAQMDVTGASTGEEALQISARMDCIHLLAVDNHLPDIKGVELVRRLRERYPKACIVMATMLDERALMAKAFEHGCDVFMVKPHGFMELFQRLQSDQLDSLMTEPQVIDQYGLRPYRG